MFTGCGKSAHLVVVKCALGVEKCSLVVGKVLTRVGKVLTRVGNVLTRSVKCSLGRKVFTRYGLLFTRCWQSAHFRVRQVYTKRSCGLYWSSALSVSDANCVCRCSQCQLNGDDAKIPAGCFLYSLVAGGLAGGAG